MKHQVLETTPEIARRMSHVHLRKGQAEVLLAKALWQRGIRYFYNYKLLPGSPDIAITKYRVAVFIDGEFWHGKDWEMRKVRLQRNREYWIRKIEENMARDMRVDRELSERGWIPVHFWEKAVQRDTDACVSEITRTFSKTLK